MSGNASTITGTDPLVDLVYALGAPYRAGANWVMNSRTAGVLRKLKDADGRYLWSDGVSQGEPARLLGYPVLIAEDMPDIAAGAHPVAFGNFQSGYTIVERPDLRVLRDPFSAKPNVLFYATKRCGRCRDRLRRNQGAAHLGLGRDRRGARGAGGGPPRSGRP